MSEGQTHPDGEKPDDQRDIKRLRQEYGLDRPASPAGRLVTSGIEFAGIVVVCILAGLWLDGRLGTKPWLLLGLMLLGMTGGTIRLIRRALRDAES